MTTSILLRGRGLLLALLALAVLPLSALAAGENYGRVSGYVYDPTGTALAEVPLTISGPALQQPVSRTSGEDGRFEFGQLPPGEGYVLEVAVEGFTPIKKTGIIVRLGQTTPVDVKLEVLTETEAVATYEIVEKVNPIINPESAQTGAVLTAEKAASTPIFNQVQAVGQLVAGVGPGTSPSSRGGLSRYGKFYVDGMDTTDVTDGSITAPMNYYAVENFEVITGGLDAQYNALGMVQNVVTKSGSNKFTYDVSLILSPAWSNAKANFASNQGSHVGDYTQNDRPQAETTFYSPLVAFGGPIVKDRLWFYASGQWNFSMRETPLTINGQQENRPTDTQTRLARLKLTWQPTDKDRLSFAFNYDNNTITNSSSNGAEQSLEAERQVNRGGFFFITNYDRTLNENVLFQLQTGATYKKAYFGPMNEDQTAIAHVDQSNGRFTTGTAGSVSSSVPGNYQHQDKLRFQFDPTLLFKVKSHQMKAGVQVGYMMGKDTQGTYGNLRYLDRGGVCNPEDPATFGFCDQRITFHNTEGELGALTTDASVLQGGVFFQDRWTVNRHLTLVGGIRADVGALYANDRKHITNLVGVGPRASATYDIMGDRKTLIKAHYGRSNEVGDVYIAQHGNPELTQVTSRWNRTTNSFADCAPGSTDTSCSTSGGATGRFFDKVHTAPSVDELSLGLHREVAEGAVLGADFTYRRYNNLWVDEEVNQIWNASGTRVDGYVDGQPHTVVRIHNPDDAWRDYKGLDLWVQGQNGPWDLLASYTLGFNNGTVGSYFDGYGANPRMKYLFEGPTPDDIRHTLKGSLGYTTPFGLDFGLRFRYLTGSPVWMYQYNSATRTNVYRSPRGTGHAVNSSTGQPDFNDPSSVSELRNPDQFVIDAQARYDLGRLLNMSNKLELTFLVVNALNNRGPTSVYDEWSTTNNRYGLARSRNRPLQAELLLRFRN